MIPIGSADYVLSGFNGTYSDYLPLTAVDGKQYHETQKKTPHGVVRANFAQVVITTTGAFTGGPPQVAIRTSLDASTSDDATLYVINPSSSTAVGTAPAVSSGTIMYWTHGPGGHDGICTLLSKIFLSCQEAGATAGSMRCRLEWFARG